MARTRERHHGMHRRLQAAAAMGMLAGMLTVGPAGAAGPSGSIRVGGRVPAHASVRLSSWTITPAIPDVTGRQRLGIANLSILANNRSFTVSLVPADRRRGNRLGLVEAVTGSELPYELSYDGISLQAIDGEIPLGHLLRAAAATEAPKGIEIRLRAGIRLGTGRYQDRLVLVIKAR